MDFSQDGQSREGYVYETQNFVNTLLFKVNVKMSSNVKCQNVKIILKPIC